LVTGASRGIGKGIALRLAQDGWSVAIHYNRGRPEADEVARLVGSAFAGQYQADLGKPELASEFVNRVAEDGPIDALVNNAGVYMPSPFADAPDAEFDETWRATFAVNLESPVRLIRSVLPIFAEQGGGKVLNVSSRVGLKSEAGAAAYAASKAALTNLTRSLAAELADKNVGFFGIAPGWVNTAMAREGMEDRIAAILPTIPLGRMASVEDCAAVASFLLSDEASYLSGQVIDINGASYFH
jgi:3-oxoacyl-[acyl-carrier protein] reductase